MEFTSEVASHIALGVLLFSGLWHAGTNKAFVESIVRQSTWPPSLVRVVAGVTILSELFLGGAGAAAILARRSDLMVGLLVASAVLYLIYAIYGGFLFFNRPNVPCGCSTTDHPINVWVVIRALLLAGVSLLALSSEPSSTYSISTIGVQEVLSITASVGLGMLLWSFPASMHNPSSVTTAHRKSVGYGS